MLRRPSGTDRGSEPIPPAEDRRLASPRPLIGDREHQLLLRAFHDLAPTDPSVEPRLRAVLRDTLEQPGSFLRAQLAFDIANQYGVHRDDAVALAVGIEYFHTASLLFDDLPMMDDADERRGRPCAHQKHGEAAAVLGALALVNQAYGLLWGALARLPTGRSRRAAGLVTTCLGARGVLGGQSRDLHLSPHTASEKQILEVALGKTVPLIRLTLHLPALVGGSGITTLTILDHLATAWGLAYQILDDCRDSLMSSAETGKSTSKDRSLGRPNLLNHAGASRVLERLDRLMTRSRLYLERLPADGGSWQAVGRLQDLLEAESDRMRRRMPSCQPACPLPSRDVEAKAC